MSNLTIDAAAVTGDPGRVDVTIELTDADGERVTGRTVDEVVVRGYRGHTDAEGVLVVDLVPNADITPANTYYTVRVRSRSFLIEKGSGAENLVDVEVTTPADLGLAATLGSLADVTTTGATNGQALVYDATAEEWEPGTVSGGGGVTSVSGTAPIVSSGGATPAISITAASTGAAGSMSSSDKSKLDGIESGATADQSAAELLTAIKTVDGTGSGLDADTVDGQHASAFEAAGAAAAAQAASQPLDSDLTAIAALSTTSYGRALLALADAAAGRTALGLGSLATASAIVSADITDGTIVNDDVNASAAIAGTKVDAATDTTRGTVELATTAETQTGTDTARAITPAGGAATYQPLDSELSAIAGLTSAADRLPYFTGSGTASLATFTAAGRNLVDDADAAAQRTTLGLGTAAVESASRLTLPQTNTSGSYVYYAPAGTRAGSTAIGAAAGALNVVPLWLPAQTYTRIGFYYYAAGTATVRLGVWNVGSDGWPDTVALDAGTVTVAAADGVVRKEITISFTPTAGWYWVGMLIDAYTSTPQMIAVTSNGGMMLLPGHRSGADTNNASGLSRTGVTTGALGTWGASGSSASVASSSPMIYLRT